jgi:hypothetical protein
MTIKQASVIHPLPQYFYQYRGYRLENFGSVPLLHLVNCLSRHLQNQYDFFGVVVYAEFWDTNSQNVEKKHSLIMAMIQVVNPIPWKMKKKDHIDDEDDVIDN